MTFDFDRLKIEHTAACGRDFEILAISNRFPDLPPSRRFSLARSLYKARQIYEQSVEDWFIECDERKPIPQHILSKFQFLLLIYGAPPC